METKWNINLKSNGKIKTICFDRTANNTEKAFTFFA